MGALTDLDVDRVDAVDRPATRRKFLIRKAEGDPDPAAVAADATKLLKAATNAVLAIRKAEGLTLPDETVDALNALVSELDPAAAPFAKSAAAPVAAPVAAAAPAVALTSTPAVAPAAAPEAAPVAAAAAIDPDVLGEAIAKALVKAIDAATPGPESIPSFADSAAAFLAPAPPPSAQPAGQEPIAKRGGTKFGEGMFSNIAFGK